MLEIGECTAKFGAIGFSEVLLPFLTDDECDELETIATRFDMPSAAAADGLELAGRIIGTALRRAEMRHPGFE